MEWLSLQRWPSSTWNLTNVSSTRKKMHSIPCWLKSMCKVARTYTDTSMMPLTTAPFSFETLLIGTNMTVGALLRKAAISHTSQRNSWPPLFLLPPYWTYLGGRRCAYQHAPNNHVKHSKRPKWCRSGDRGRHPLTHEVYWTEETCGMQRILKAVMSLLAVSYYYPS